MDKSGRKLLLLILIFDLLLVSITFKGMIKKAYNVPSALKHTNPYFVLSPIDVQFYAYKSIEWFYFTLQDRHGERTDVNLELFEELVERRQLVRARNASLHNLHDCDNLKYLSLNGKNEYIVKVEYEEDGDVIFVEIITDHVNKGTYNLFNQEGTWLTRKLHKVDVYLWILYGTGRDDPTNIFQRLYYLYNRPNSCDSLEEELDENA